MLFSSDFKRIALDSLKGRWGVAVIAGLVAGVFGSSSGTGFNFSMNFPVGGSANTGGAPSDSFFETAFGVAFTGIFIYMIIAALVIGIAFFVLGSIVDVGYAGFNLDLVDRKPTDINRLFSYKSFWKTTLASRLWQTLYVFCWMLLFFVPGIIATYSYAMTPYVLAENPNMAPREAICRSKEMMHGNRMRLFELQISFIGWAILAVFTCGIGALLLTPYMNAATAAFYREVSGTWYMSYEFEPLQMNE